MQNDHLLAYQNRQKTVLLNQTDIAELRQQLLNYFQQTFKLYESLFKCLKNGAAFFEYPNRLRHPLIFYYGHTATFYINKFVFMKLFDSRVNEQFESMFAIGVDEMSWDDLNSTEHHWPTVAAVQQYRDTVYELISNYIKTMPLQSPIKQEDPAWIVLMGIEHEHIHLETSAVLIRELPLQHVQPQSDWKPCHESNSAKPNALIHISAGIVKVDKQTETFGWDNEYGNAESQVDAFNASQYLVSNQEFLEFINANGYAEKKYWTEEGWQWCQTMKINQPHFWRKNNDEWLLRLLTDEISMPWNWPVEVNYFEAKAFCNFLTKTSGKNIRLPTEAEWHLLAKNCKAEYPHWEQAPANIDLAYLASSCPNDRFRHGDLYDVIGNVWQWTETAINGFEGFVPHPAYDDFSVPTFDGKHHIFKGGSWISCGNEVLKESRYAFRKHFFQFAGIRYVEANPLTEIKTMYYETDSLLSQYLELHYGPDYFKEKNFMAAVIDTVMQYLPTNTARHKALDLGCAVGRGTFELARYFEQVYGVDFSARFIQDAARLQQAASLEYAVNTEGDLIERRSINLTELKITPEITSKVVFLQGDACNLHQHLKDFDLIVASNLIDRLYDPKKFLLDIIERMNTNAVLAICSPYTWLEEHTQKDHWLGGFLENGKPVTTLSGLQKVLKNHLRLLTDPIDIPFVIRETARKFQHSISELTLWQK